MTGTVPVYQWQPSTGQIAERAGISADDVIRFDHNTSPHCPPWVTEAAAEAAARVNEYPAADYTPLRSAIADYSDVDVDMVVPGAGADEMIILAARAFLEAGARAAADSPGYPMYRIATAQRGGHLTEVGRSGPDWAFPADDMVAASSAAALTWICEPHNPTGTAAGGATIDAICEASAGIVVIDAAYAEYAGDRWAAALERHGNLVVLGTMSKAFGLAGIRVGWSLSRPDLAGRLHAVRPPGSVSTVSAAIAIRGLEDRAWMDRNVADRVAERDALTHALEGLGLAATPSATNFVLCGVGPGARDLMDGLMIEGLVVRAFPADGPLCHHLRFTVRTSRQHERLIDALRRHL